MSHQEGHAISFKSDPVDMKAAAYACDVVATCPGLFLSVPDDAYVVVGATLDHRVLPSVSETVSPLETAVRLPRSLLEDSLINAILKEQSWRFVATLMVRCFLTLLPLPKRHYKLKSTGRHLTRKTAPAGVSN
jgi:hypothetical protein